MLDSVEGRTTDFVVAEDGTILHGLALIYVLRDMPGVANFRIVQESRQLTRVEVVPREILTGDMTRDIRKGLGARLGQGVTIEVSEEGRDCAGKVRKVSLCGKQGEGVIDSLFLLLVVLSVCYLFWVG